MENLKAWAADMDTKEKRDFIFVYVWCLARILAELACAERVDKEYMEAELMARIMESLDRGRYKGTGSFMGWLFMQAVSVIRDVGFELYRQRVPTVRLIDEWDKSVTVADESPKPDDERLKEEIRGWMDWFEEEEVSRLLNMLYVQEMTLKESASVLGVNVNTASAWHKAAVTALVEALYVD